jgi:hypothetical protein
MIMATEAALSILLVSVLNAGLSVRGVIATVQKDNQPRQEGIPNAATIFFHHVGTVNIGWPEKQDVWNAANGNFDHIETQRRESRYQISALAPQTPSDPTLPTPADFCNQAAAVMQSDVTIATLVSNGIGIRHITDIISIYFQDDKGQQEENPSFDIIFAHQDVFTTTTPIINDFTEKIEGI